MRFPRTLRRLNRRNAYTLIETLMTVAIIGTLMVLLVVAVSHVLHSTRERLADVELAEMEMAAAREQPVTSAAPLPERFPDPAPIPHQFMLTFPAGTDPLPPAQALVDQWGGRVVSSYQSGLESGATVYLPGLTLDQVQAPGAEIEQDSTVYPCLDAVPTGVSRQKVANNAPVLSSRDPTQFGLPNVEGVITATPGKKIVVVVLDTGVDAAHPDLNVNRAMSRAFGPFAPDFLDGAGHGTHVAGTIGAKADGRGVIGVYPGVEIWAVRVLDSTGTGTNSQVLQGLNYIYENRAQIAVVNMSFAGGESSAINRAVNACADAGIVMVAAAGNSARDVGRSSPANATKVICVAALADSDGKYGARGPATRAGEDDSFATFSSFGSAVDVIAPGVSIVSTVPNGRYASYSGTSMAAPHVAGLMAMHQGRVVVTRVNGVLTNRPATGLEIAAILVRLRGADAIAGRFDSRRYPLLVTP